MKKAIIGVITFCVLFVFSLAVYVWPIIPRNEIQALKNGFVHIEKIKPSTKKGSTGSVRFNINKKRPKNWVELRNYPKTVKDMIVLSEDWAFFQHEGVDLSQVKKSIEESLFKGKKLRGASTISQQVVKNLFLSNERSYLRKFKEVIIVKHLERELSKEKILEVYFNILHLGDGLYSVQKASQYYFKKNYRDLTYKEAAFLAMLLPNPMKYSQSFRQKELTPFAKEQVAKIMGKLKLAKKLNSEQLKREMSRHLNWEKKRERGSASLKQKWPRKFIDGKTIEANLKIDRDMLVDDELTYDDDALIEDESGFQNEFNIE
ncbi:MAG: biosynthetic peptidoglycan transglycosylase [Bacteriovoracaceae bacterium]